ncbi:MAG: hypothetical protein AB7G17_11215 [Phycisphaerales bacterium]
MALRLGEILVSRGVLSAEQVEGALAEQAEYGGAFGDIVERMFGVSAGEVERAWAEQYAGLAEQVDPRDEIVERDALLSVSARQAWQFRLLPLRRDGEEMVLCTTQEHLPRALRFVYRSLKERCSFVIAEPGALGEALEEHFPLPGLDAECVRAGVRVA